MPGSPFGVNRRFPRVAGSPFGVDPVPRSEFGFVGSTEQTEGVRRQLTSGSDYSDQDITVVGRDRGQVLVEALISVSEPSGSLARALGNPPCCLGVYSSARAGSRSNEVCVSGRRHVSFGCAPCLEGQESP